MAKDTERAALRKVERRGTRTQSRAERRKIVDSYERKHAPQPQRSQQGLESSHSASGAPQNGRKRP